MKPPNVYTLHEQEGTAEDDTMNSCSKMEDGNVVLTGATFGNWDGTPAGDISAVAVKLDVTDGTVLWRYQVRVAFSSSSRSRSSRALVVAPMVLAALLRSCGKLSISLVFYAETLFAKHF